MNTQFKSQPKIEGDAKQPPPLEVSMKYAAWDIKSIPPAIKELTNEIKLLRFAILGKNEKSVDNPEIMF